MIIYLGKYIIWSTRPVCTTATVYLSRQRRSYKKIKRGIVPRFSDFYRFFKDCFYFV